MSAGQPLAQRVFGALADGRVHSGEQLAQAHGVSRSAVWKAVGQLQELGVAIEAATHRGYRLARPGAALDAQAITGALAADVRARLRSGTVAWTLGSTNDELLARAEPAPGAFDYLLAEYQKAGRGRRARPWFAPPGGGLCLSLGWSFATLPREAPSLSLAIGVCVLRALARFGVAGVQLKWPNDLWVRDRKLGGILIELRAEGAGAAYVVIGLGLNCALGTDILQRVQHSGTEPIDLVTLGVSDPDRNRLGAQLIGEIVRGVLAFERSGLAAFATEWSAADALAGRVVSVSSPAGVSVGHARGIDGDGALCVQGASGLQRFHTGEVSVRVGQ